MAGAGLDFIVTIATPPTQAMVNFEPEAPVFFISVSNPVGAGVITEIEHPDKNATGASNAIPVDEMFKLAARVTPKARTFGLIYNSGEINSVTTINAAKAYMDKMESYSYKEAVVTASSWRLFSASPVSRFSRGSFGHTSGFASARPATTTTWCGLRPSTWTPRG